MKVAIIGCSASGGWLGWKLAERGEDVTIFERKKEIGGKVCSGLVSERIWQLVPENGSLIENVIEAVNIHFPKKTVKAEFGQRMLALNRGQLDRLLSDLAVGSGAKLYLGSGFRELKEMENSVLVISENVTKEFDRVIGCDGALSRVRSHFIGAGKIKVRAGVQCFQPVKDCSDTVDVWPTASGFFWKIPRGRSVEWGLFEKKENTADMWKAFAEKNSLEGLPAHGAIIPEGVAATKSNMVALCGDAAGLTKPWSGGGILWGITSAGMLLEKWPRVNDYEVKMKNYFSRKIALGRFATKFVTRIGRSAPWLIPSGIRFDSDWLI